MDKINVECQANYNSETFHKYYGESEQELRKCDGCPYMEFVDGIMTCTKFN